MQISKEWCVEILTTRATCCSIFPPRSSPCEFWTEVRACSLQCPTTTCSANAMNACRKCNGAAAGSPDGLGNFVRWKWPSDASDVRREARSGGGKRDNYLVWKLYFKISCHFSRNLTKIRLCQTNTYKSKMDRWSGVWGAIIEQSCDSDSTLSERDPRSASLSLSSFLARVVYRSID